MIKLLLSQLRPSPHRSRSATGKRMRQKLAVIISVAVCVVGITLSCQRVEPRFKFPESDVYLKLARSAKLQYVVMRGSRTLQTVTLDNFETSNGLVLTASGSITLSSTVAKIEFTLLQQTADFVHIRVTRQNLDTQVVQRDCIDLGIGHTHWFGGQQTRLQYWPIERATVQHTSYLTKEELNFGVAERYWLSSKGVFIYVEDETPLFVEQNTAGHENQLCFTAKNLLPYNTHRTKFSFSYQIGVGANAKEAHLKAVNRIFGKPSSYPDERMVRQPIWSTWALYKAEIDDAIVRDFGQKILDNQFTNSQLEIDDDWEICYGALEFRPTKFPDIKQLTTDLKEKGFRVTLWVHPFINKGCEPYYSEAKEKGYLVKDHSGNPDTQWWNSVRGDAAYIDFTNPAAAKWYADRLKKLQTEDGIDSFKFDAGESSWTPPDPVLTADDSFHPSAITRAYVKTVAEFGKLVEVRSGQGTQTLPIFVRMIDKDSNWGWNNGLVTLITTLLQLNLNGYPLVLPDMIGGNGYDNKTPNKELFIRWLQANVFMPSLQFSYVPWMYGDEAITICRKFTELHERISPLIMERFDLLTRTGEPVNAPLWWLDPEDEVALTIYDQFLLGDKIIAAPIVVEGAIERDIYLPKGTWKDGNSDEVHVGPKWIMRYSAPLEVLPYFVRSDVVIE